jgi:hypothetical protein
MDFLRTLPVLVPIWWTNWGLKAPSRRIALLAIAVLLIEQQPESR